MSEAIRQRNAKTFLDWMLGIVMARYTRMPALGGGLVVKDTLVWSGVRGVRRKGYSTAVQINDRFQLGSITKPMTGYLLAVLRQQGKLDWNSTLGDSFPGLFDDVADELKQRSDLQPHERNAWLQHCREVTTSDLMTHTSGFDYAPSRAQPPLGDTRLATVSANVSAQLPAKRRLYTKLAMLDRPFAGWGLMKTGLPPMTKYSSGCILAAAMAEESCNSSWELLMANHVFAPLGMTRYSFANASSKTSVTDLWQHRLDADQVVSAAIPEETQNSYTRSPSGAVSLSMPSWGQWAKALLATSDQPQLSLDGLERYCAFPTLHFNCTRGGWFQAWTGSPYLSHNGSNGWNHADMRFSRSLGVAALAATNIGYPLASDGTGHLLGELLGVGEAWPAMEHLSASLAQAELVCTADSEWAGDVATNLTDTGFRTCWRSTTLPAELTITLDEERWLQGLVMCQNHAARIQSFQLKVMPTLNGDFQVLDGAALDALTQREGIVIKVLFAQPTRVRRMVLKMLTATANPCLSRLMVMTYQPSRPRSFAIGTDGQLWLCDHAQRVLGTHDTLQASQLAMDRNTLGVGPQVACGGGKLWAIGENNKLWSSSGNGWQAAAGSPVLKRIAVDGLDDSIWAIDSTDAVRQYSGGQWRQPPGGQRGLDVCGHAGKAWAVGLDGAVYASTSGGWARLPGTAPSMKRITLDRSTLKLWGLDAGGGIRSRAQASTVWLEHPHNGVGKDIDVHAGSPYVIGTDDGLWRSVAQAAWQRLSVMQLRG